MLIDPTSDKSARTVAEKLIPDQTTRKIILNFLADSIIKVHKQGKRSSAWSVTLAKNSQYIRMNVGNIEVFAIFFNMAHIIIDFSNLPNTDVARLRQLKGDVFKETPVYVSVPCSQSWDFPSEQFPATISIIRNSHESLLEEASSSVKTKTRFNKSHSSGVLEYLRQELGRNIPDPSYD